MVVLISLLVVVSVVFEGMKFYFIARDGNRVCSRRVSYTCIQPIFENHTHTCTSTHRVLKLTHILIPIGFCRFAGFIRSIQKTKTNMQPKFKDIIHLDIKYCEINIFWESKI